MWNPTNLTPRRRGPRAAHHHHDGFGPQGGPRGAGRGPFGPGFGPGGPGPFGPGFGPRGGGRGRRAGRGDVRLAVLSLLAEAPSNGYGLIKAIAEKTGDAWRPSPGSVYPTLQQLVDEGLVTTTGEGRSTEHALTDEGRTYVADNAEAIAATWASTPGLSAADAAFHESAMKLRGAIQQLRHSGTDAQKEAAATTLDEARRALYLLLAE